jgi:hypothetical protein
MQLTPTDLKARVERLDRLARTGLAKMESSRAA